MLGRSRAAPGLGRKSGRRGLGKPAALRVLGVFSRPSWVTTAWHPQPSVPSAGSLSPAWRDPQGRRVIHSSSLLVRTPAAKPWACQGTHGESSQVGEALGWQERGADDLGPAGDFALLSRSWEAGKGSLGPASESRRRRLRSSGTARSSGLTPQEWPGRVGAFGKGTHSWRGPLSKAWSVKRAPGAPPDQGERWPRLSPCPGWEEGARSPAGPVLSLLSSYRGGGGGGAPPHPTNTPIPIPLCCSRPRHPVHSNAGSPAPDHPSW